MEKLTLKEIAGYLPYELKVLHIDTDEFEQNEIITELETASVECLTFKDGADFYFENSDVTIKPLLHSLEMLTKTIVHNGVEIIPIEYFEIGDDSDSYPYEFDNGNIKLIKHLELLAKHNFHHDIKFLPYEVVRQLQVWHFDIFGLIKLGKAIDKSTLNNK